MFDHQMSGPLLFTKIIHPATTISVSHIKTLSKINSSSNEVHKKGLILLQKEVDLNYKPHVITDVDIGPQGQGIGHAEFVGDAMQLLNLTIMFLCTKQTQYAKKAISIQDQWNIKCKTFKGSNAPLECAWGSICMLRSMEILKYTYDGFRSYEGFQERFSSFLNLIILPNLTNRYKEITKWNNNWILTIQEALLQYYLYMDDINNANKILNDFRAVLPKCIIHDCGICTETTRDLIHSQFQLGSIVQIAEVCWNQGLDIYSVNKNTIYKCLEYHARILNGNIPVEMNKNDLKDVWFMPSIWDIAYNHYKNRMKCLDGMPQTDKLLRTKCNRPEKLTFNWGPAWVHYSSH